MKAAGSFHLKNYASVTNLTIELGSVRAKQRELRPGCCDLHTIGTYVEKIARSMLLWKRKTARPKGRAAGAVTGGNRVGSRVWFKTHESGRDFEVSRRLQMQSRNIRMVCKAIDFWLPVSGPGSAPIVAVPVARLVKFNRSIDASRRSSTAPICSWWADYIGNYRRAAIR